MISPGQAAYHLVYRPLGAWRRMVAAGGPLEILRTARGRREMEAAAETLPMPAGQGPAVEVHVLSGSKFWQQTVFCLWSFAQCSGRPLRPHIYDDGSLGRRACEVLVGLWPETRIVTHGETLEKLDRFLPRPRFPTLRERWDAYPNIRKLTDVHLGETGWKLVMDSDLLFFRCPRMLLDWLDAPDRPLHAVDAEHSYGYPDATLEELAGHPLPDRLNVGLCGLRGEAIDWDLLERWTRELIARHGTHYFLEQALVAMLVAGGTCAVAPAQDYLTGPVLPEAEECRAVMHHYVADTKRWYFRHNWRRCLAGPVV